MSLTIHAATNPPRQPPPDHSLSRARTHASSPTRKPALANASPSALPPALLPKSTAVLRTLASDWRSLTIGTEGYLSTPHRAGLYRHPIVWGEQDSMGHVNNVQYVRYAESGRTEWTRNFGKHFDAAHRADWDSMLTSRAVGLILKSITVDFKFPMTWPDRITVSHKLREMPDESTESMVLDVVILSERMQRPAARCLEDVVVYDYRAGKKSGMPAFMLDQFKHVWELQEAEKASSAKKVEQLLKGRQGA